MEINQYVYLSLGSNLGDRMDNLNFAFNAIKDFGVIKSKSSIYECQAIGFESSDLFYNCCICIETNLKPIELLHQLNTIEKNAGRIRLNDGNYHSRNLDIDIIFFQDQVIQTDILSIPHPRYHKRKFVLIPLNEISAELKDPISQLTTIEILANCKDNSDLKKITF